MNSWSPAHRRDLLKPPSATGWPGKPAHIVMVDICRARHALEEKR
jgi:hypothetical protein